MYNFSVKSKNKAGLEKWEKMEQRVKRLEIEMDIAASNLDFENWTNLKPKLISRVCFSISVYFTSPFKNSLTIWSLFMAGV